MKRDHRQEVSSCINTEEKVAMSRERRLSGTKHSKPARKRVRKKETYLTVSQCLENNIFVSH